MPVVPFSLPDPAEPIGSKAFRAQNAAAQGIDAPSMDQSNHILGQLTPQYMMMAAAAMHAQGRLIKPQGSDAKNK